MILIILRRRPRIGCGINRRRKPALSFNMATATEVSQMTIGELVEFTASLLEAIRLKPDAEKLRPAVEESLNGECVQCGIRVTGRELLKLGEGNNESDPKLERLKSGYC